MDNYSYAKTVKVYDREKYDGDWMPENLVDAVAWLQGKLDSIPQEYRSAATIEIDSGISYDCSYASIRIEYSRPPTDAEIAERRDEARRRSEEEMARAKYNLAAAEARLAKLRS